MRGSTWSPERKLVVIRVEADVAGGVAGRPDGPEVPPGKVDALVVLNEDVGEGHVERRLYLHGGQGEVGQLVLRHA
jgi:hypothetical protein